MNLRVEAVSPLNRLYDTSLIPVTFALDCIILTEDVTTDACSHLVIAALPIESARGVECMPRPQLALTTGCPLTAAAHQPPTTSLP